MSLKTFFNRYLPPLEAEMRAVVQTSDPRYAGLFGMLRYHMGWADAAFNPCQARTGKRVRPVLCLLACEACGGDWEQALPAAAALELMHNFSLIHDDIEDQDKTRRGRPTIWALWGEAQAINAGDVLFVLAQLALLRLSERGALSLPALSGAEEPALSGAEGLQEPALSRAEGSKGTVPATTVVMAIRLFNHACLALTGGQYLDIGFESRDSVSTADYLTMIEGKTGALVACACEMGSLVAAAPAVQRENLRTFGHHLGLVFQMRDDVLGIWGDPIVTGKPAGADIARLKKSLPILHGLEQSAELRALLAQETLSTADVHRATELLRETDSREYAEQLAQEFHAQALAALDQANLHGPAALALHELAQMLLSRER